MRRKDREVTDRKGIEEILKLCKTCHVAMVEDGKPYIVPLSYGYCFLKDGTLELYFHSAAEGKKLDILRKNNQVCFEISCEGEPVHAEIPCNSGYYYSSIIGNGTAVFIEGTEEKCRALSSMFKQQTGRELAFQEGQTLNLMIYKIVSKDFTGKRKPLPEK